ncbi:signal transduction histidine kinase/ligand-binding sensor domain-containing protein/CheY-like chemotaxis protein [Catalinimonas alkaloidigena]|uniref:hybrid sensor histidine kinase/response regulator n=1 Tax=Catalinimonas alkaloidigena TaxID=1075417 RepID=UPI002406F352|nr:hybrid sensor histidine kinase/response regulator [Catalinimonas alkaloidigena]MDF9797075.1 signal transduction histidine kinase/ligand-binding sensor domain-containing protein/CheY-like chemotaxis protein [Catalinimonas alkaloidigena]
MKSRIAPITISLLLFYLHPCTCHAQNEDFHFEQLSERQGLSNNNVWSIIQDSEGFMWFGTLDGLNKYDGYSFTVLKPDPEDPENTLHHNIISDIHEDREGRLWVTTFGGGFHQIDKSTGKVTRFEIRANYTGFWNTLGSIYEDKEGFLWISAVGGVARFDPISHQFMLYPHPARHGMNLTSIEDEKGRFWAGHERGVYLLDRKTGEYMPFLLDSTLAQQPGVWSLYIDKKGILWAGTNGEGLFCLDTQQEPTRFARFDPEGLINKTFFWSFNGIYEDLQGYLWISTFEGLQRINKETQEVFTFPYDPMKPGSISHERVKTVYQDRTGAFWIGTENGVNVAHAKKFLTYQITPTLPSVWLKENEIGSLVEDHTGMIWLTNSLFSINKELYQFDPETGQAKHFPTYLSHSSERAAGNVLSVYEDREKRLWVGTSEALLLLDRNTKKFTQYLTDITVQCIDEDTSGMLWLGGNMGISSFDPESSHFEYYLFDINDSASLAPQSNSVIHSFDVIDLIVSSTGEIWIGYLGAGVDRFNSQTGTFTHYLPDSDSPKGKLNDRDLRALYEDKDGIIWIGTMLGGLNRFDPLTNSFDYYTEHDGLPNNHIASIISDNNGNLWLGTNQGISRFNPQTKEFRNYDITDGLPANHFQGGDAYRCNDKLMFGSLNGFTIFYPDSIKSNTKEPPVYITNFQVMEEEREVPSHSINLPYDENFISFDFVALNYDAPEKNQYAYMLEGLDKDWVHSDTRRFASYTDLDPGEYTFRVRASNNDGIWNEEGTFLQVIILPPWWQTGWAYALYTILGLGLLYSLRQYTVKRERLKHELNIQRLEAEKMHEIDRMKSRFFANISHEFRTPLTLILGPLDKLLTEADESRKELYQMMGRNAARLLNLINQLLDLAKLEAGSLELNLQPYALLPFLKGIVLSFSSLAERKNIKYNFQYPLENPVLYIDADKLEKVITNLLSNAFKFTPTGGEVLFSAFLKQEEGKTKNCLLEIQVKDSGMGITEAQQSRIFNRYYQADTTKEEGSGIGLSLVSELVNLHQGNISVESEPDNGSCFYVTIPLEKADFEEVQIHEHEEPISKKISEDTLPLQTTEDIVEAPHILLVEDNEDVRSFIKYILQDMYQVSWAGDGQEGLQKAIEYIPDLILSDVMMPQMDGITLCEKLRQEEKTSHIPIIMLTAKASGGDKIEGLKTGADDYIIKPFQAEELLIRIENLITSRQQLREQLADRLAWSPCL